MKKSCYIVVTILLSSVSCMMRSDINNNEYLVSVDGGIVIEAQNDSDIGDGSDIIIRGSSGGSTSGKAGSILITAQSSATGDGGNITMLAGAAGGAGVAGKINVQSSMNFAPSVDVSFPENGTVTFPTGTQVTFDAGTNVDFGTATVNLGTASVEVSSIKGTDSGGDATVEGGDGSGAGAGGKAVVKGGVAGATGAGGSVEITASNGGTTSGAGGDITIVAGSGTGGGLDGNIRLATGGSTFTATLSDGDIGIKASGVTYLEGTFDTTNATGIGGGGSGDSITGTDATGGSNNSGGNATAIGGAGDGTGAGGKVVISGGVAGTNGGAGGDIEITASVGDANTIGGNGGSVFITAGDGGISNGSGGDITLTAGTAAGTGNDGTINMKSDTTFEPGKTVDFTKAKIKGFGLKSALGELKVAEITPVIQLNFFYNVNQDYVAVTETNGGVVSMALNFATLQAFSSGDEAIIESRNILRYHPGQGHESIISAVFIPPGSTAGAEGIAGIGNNQDGLFFGYRYDSTVKFGIMQRTNGVDVWIDQSSWSEDVMDGTGPSGVTLNPAVGNTYKIQYKGTGFETINFYIENPLDGSWILVHKINTANIQTTTALRNPSLKLYAKATNDILMGVTSMSAFVEGKFGTAFQVRNGFDASQSVNTTEDTIVIFSNKSTYQSKNNQVLLFPKQLSLLNTSNSDAICKVYLVNRSDVTGGSFSDYSTNTSVVEINTNTTTVPSGKLLFTFFSVGLDKFDINLSDYDIVIRPEECLVITGETITGSTNIYTSLTWSEEF